MNFLLKIVGGPNQGAEIALVEGVAVTLGKREDCDIVLADKTLPDAPVKIEPGVDGVSVDGERLAQFQIATVGATSFAVGPADAPWSELKWPEREKPSQPADAPATAVEPAAPAAPAAADERKRRGGCFGCFGCIVALVVLLLVLAGLGWHFRDRVRDSGWTKFIGRFGGADAAESGEPSAGRSSPDLVAIAGKYGLSYSAADNGVTISGNLKTRRERLSAMGEAYAAQPWVNLDISDDESFRTAADDALFTLTEGALKVAAATNRVLRIVGSAPSPDALKRTLKALAADLPKLRDADVKGVAFSSVAADDAVGGGGALTRAAKKRRAQSFPVCGILTTPYPCLVMRNGLRVMEGATMGDSVIVKICADSVVLTNSTGRFTWKP